MTTGQLANALAAEGLELEQDARFAFPLVAPASEEQLASVVARAGRDGLRVLPLGLGSKLSFTRPEALAAARADSDPIDLALSTQKLQEVQAYEPGDGTLTAAAGARWSDLAARVGRGGHRLTPDVPFPQRASLGGVLAAGLSGPDRLRDGPLRHHVLGMRVVRSDGSGSRTGGRLVKNVTGFDLHRLYCGSRGTLCVIVEASLRLFPAPHAERALSVRSADVRRLFQVCARGAALRRTPPRNVDRESIRRVARRSATLAPARLLGGALRDPRLGARADRESLG